MISKMRVSRSSAGIGVPITIYAFTLLSTALGWSCVVVAALRVPLILRLTLFAAATVILGIGPAREISHALTLQTATQLAPMLRVMLPDMQLIVISLLAITGSGPAVQSPGRSVRRG